MPLSVGLNDLELLPGRPIGEGKPTFIIAEIGQNHNGDIQIAKKLIEQAQKIGADCVKFQKSSLEDKFTTTALERQYDSIHSYGNTYGDHKRFLEFSFEEYQTLLDFAKDDIGIPMIASAMDSASVDVVIDTFKMPFIKIGSGDSNNPILLEKVAKRSSVNAVISTGMSDMDDVHRIYKLFKKYRTQNNFIILHCTSSYPTAFNAVNLNVLIRYKEQFPDIHIGYSGHELGYVPTIGAVALGARVVERHITLDKTMKGNDHKCSLDVNEFAEMVRSIRNIELSLGSPEKKFQKCEEDCFKKLGKSLVACKFLGKGCVISAEDVCIKVAIQRNGAWRPQDINKLIGKTCNKDISKEELIMLEHIIM